MLGRKSRVCLLLLPSCSLANIHICENAHRLRFSSKLLTQPGILRTCFFLLRASIHKLLLQLLNPEVHNKGDSCKIQKLVDSDTSTSSDRS